MFLKKTPKNYRFVITTIRAIVKNKYRKNYYYVISPVKDHLLYYIYCNKTAII